MVLIMWWSYFYVDIWVGFHCNENARTCRMEETDLCKRATPRTRSSADLGL